jgi:hypothetical protein
LARGGLQISFKGKGVVVVLLAIVPNIVEACTAAGIAYSVTEMPIEVCFTLGYVLSNVAASIIVPNML